MLNTFDASASKRSDRDKAIEAMEAAAAELSGGGVPRTIQGERSTSPSHGDHCDASSLGSGNTGSSSVRGGGGFDHHPAPSEAIENARKFLWDSDADLGAAGLGNIGPSTSPGGNNMDFSGGLNDVAFHISDSNSVGPGVPYRKGGDGAPRRSGRRMSADFMSSGGPSTGNIEQSVGGLFGSSAPSSDDRHDGSRGHGPRRGKMPGRGSMDATSMFQQNPPMLYQGQYDYDDNEGGYGSGIGDTVRAGMNNVGSAVSSGFTNIFHSLGSSSNRGRKDGETTNFNRNMAPRRPSGDPLDYAEAIAKMQPDREPKKGESVWFQAKELVAEGAYGISHVMRGCTASVCNNFDTCKKPILLVAAAAIIIGIVALGGDSVHSGSQSVAKGGGATLKNPADDTNIDPDRLTAVQARILGSGVSDMHAINQAGTPQYQAIRWLTASDDANLAPDDPYLIQRYALAVFFFTTYVTSEMEDRAGLPSVSDPNISPGSEWKVVQNWMSGEGYCSWNGIQCHKNEDGSTVYDANAGVTHLNLTHNNVRGYLPGELGALTDLRVLDMGQNGLTGSIPSSLADLPLTTLYLGDNDLTGVIPTELGEVKTLSRLYLDRNIFRGGIPAEFANLENLELLGLHENYLEGPLPDMSKWTKLRALYADDNELSGTLSPSIGALTHLVDLRLSGNRLYSSIPPEIGNMASLQELYLQQNSLSGSLPSEMSELTQLREMQLYDNRFEGSIPPNMFANLGDLEVLYLDHNGLTGPLPASWGCQELRHLYIQSNRLESSIPEDISALTNLQQLYLHDNKLEGQVPAQLGALKRLEMVRLDGNNLSGQMPLDVCMLKDHSLVDLQGDCAVGKLQCDCCTQCH